MKFLLYSLVPEYDKTCWRYHVFRSTRRLLVDQAEQNLGQEGKVQFKLMLVLAVMCWPLLRPETAPEGAYTYFPLCACLDFVLRLERARSLTTASFEGNLLQVFSNFGSTSW
uniref:Uncharacterized protein n=1 Tax=Chromera velia CCMP2878 TaxID=1169474 RepID=A0A0G4FZY9_9ALVE|eukprot:Cvel_3938.t1-p1 / transcript=Cvel_3938.t1 / gene=Cvel_3938 / organism=Chromera_velia_CCMP2878 / gene_product=hypothetical protein / transcript_product=hypothetical protein / location=Cvel_scaffold167:29746-36900(+) / protein_length=111 / sequence_SO=supercontig / SO=protein_coding / is_pseudo=false